MSEPPFNPKYEKHRKEVLALGVDRRIKNLRLNLEAAKAGKFWLLLPEGFRSTPWGTIYPLPARREELLKLATITIPPRKKDVGCIYIRRAIKEWGKRDSTRNAALNRAAKHELTIRAFRDNLQRDTGKMRKKCWDSVADVQTAAAKACASLTDLFALAKKGIEGQMKAHLAGKEWQGEVINARAFRECFRMVTQTVKGLGLPSNERSKAKEAVMEEVGEALKATQDALNLAPGAKDDTEN